MANQSSYPSDATPQKPNIGFRLIRALPFLISILLLALLLSRFKGYHLFLQINLPLFALALFISLTLNAFLGAYKWRGVMRLSDIHAGYWETWRLWVGLYPLTFVMPFHTGHILYAVTLKKAKQVGYFEAIENVAYGKYLNVVATFCLIGIGQLVIPKAHPLARTWILLLAVAVILFYLIDHRVIRALSFIDFIKRHSKLFKKDEKFSYKLYLFILATIYQGTDVISTYFACHCLGIDIPFRTVLGIFPIVLLLTYIPPTFSGFGAREGLTALMFGNLMTYDQAIAVGLLVSFLEYIAPAIFGLIALRHPYRVLTQGVGSLWKSLAKFRTRVNQ